MSASIDRVTVQLLKGEDDLVVARITVKANGVMATYIDESDTDFFGFWGDHLGKIIAKLQDDCNNGAATGGDKENDG